MTDHNLEKPNDPDNRAGRKTMSNEIDANRSGSSACSHSLTDDDRREIDCRITERILAFRRGLIATGQIEDIPCEGPLVNPPAFDCIQPEHTQWDVRPTSPPPLSIDSVR